MLILITYCSINIIYIYIIYYIQYYTFHGNLLGFPNANALVPIIYYIHIISPLKIEFDESHYERINYVYEYNIIYNILYIRNKTEPGARSFYMLD
jgi:hypothetical protein